MSRIRTIKPGFFLDDEVAALDPLDRLAWIGLWCCADKAGRMEDRPTKLKVQILPYDSGDFGDRLDRLEEAGRIIRYTGVDGKRYIQIVNWEDHQKPHHTEQNSTIPPPSVPERKDNGSDTVEERIGREGKGKEREEEKERSSRARDESPDDVHDSEPDWIELVKESWNTECAKPGLPFQRVDVVPYADQQILFNLYRYPEFRNGYGALFKRVAASVFLRGGGSRAWIADFGWIIRQERFREILEGKYDDKQQNNRPSGGGARGNAQGRSVGIPEQFKRILASIRDPEERVGEALRLGIIPERSSVDEIKRIEYAA